MTHVVPRPLVDDHEADSQLRVLLSSARSESSVSDADLARFTARFSPLVGLPLLASAAPSAASAPVSPAGLELAGKAALATGKAAAGKIVAASALKLTVASFAVGASLWFARDVIRPAPVGVASQQQLAPQQPAAAEVVVPAPVSPAAQVEPRREDQPVAAPVAATAVKRRAAHGHVKPAVVRAVPDELTLIRDAQAVRKQPARALALLAEHRQLYPAGLLSQEREVLAVEALLASGRRVDAEARASAFTRAYPGSVHMARLRSMLQQPLAD